MEILITDGAKAELDKLFYGKSVRIHPKNKT